MPRGDGTGPMGMGPMTGRAQGFCAGYTVPGHASPNFGMGRGIGRGFGRGFGRGGMGRGFCGWFRPYTPRYNAYDADPYGNSVTPQQEMGMLKEQSKIIQEEMNAVNDRIKELESSAKEKK